MVRSRSPGQPLAIPIGMVMGFAMGFVSVLGTVSKTTTRGAVAEDPPLIGQPGWLVPVPLVPENRSMPDGPKAHCCQKAATLLGPSTKLPNGCAPTPLGSTET